MLTISLLGKPLVTVDGQPIGPFPTAKAVALLGYLALERDGEHPREQLAVLFWPEHDDAAGRQNLSQTLARLRRTLGPAGDCLVATRQTVYLAENAPLEIDAVVFENLLEQTNRHSHTRKADCAHCLALLTQAAALVRGNLLEGVQLDDNDDFDQWLLIQRERIRELVLEAFTDLADGGLAQGQAQTAIAYARRQIALEAWREQASRQLMQGLLLDGRRSAALQEYERLRAVLAAELGVEPTAETQRLAAQIRSANTAATTVAANAPAAARPGNLPVTLTSFIGREEEVADILRLLDEDDARLVTLTGPGGIGKTRLALEVAQRLAANPHGSPGGVWFVSLVGVTQAANVPAAVAAALTLPPPKQHTSAVEVIEQLRNRDLLLVLDNFEQVQEARNWVLELLRAAPHVRLIVTSRERLRLLAEACVELTGLAWPPATASAAQARNFAATRLFLVRSRRLFHSFRLTDANWPHVVAICSRLQGLPLGIELAVTLLENHSIDVVADLIAGQPDTLRTDYLDMAPHQRSLEQVFEASWERLTPEEKVLLRRLSVFETGFTRSAALAVGDGRARDLTALTHKSLLRMTTADQYTLHPLVRQFAAGKLRSDEAHALQQAHAGYFAALLEREAPAVFDKSKHLQLPTLLPLLPDLRSAWGFCVRTADAALIEAFAPPLYRLLRETAQLQEGRQLFERACRQLAEFWPAAERTPAQQLLLARLEVMWGFFRFFCGDLAGARPLLEAALETFAAAGLWQEQELPLSLLNELLGHLGEHAARLQLCQRALDLATAGGDPLKVSRALVNLGAAFYHLDRQDEAREAHLRSLNMMDAVEPDFEQAITISNLGLIELASGNLARARALLEQSLRIRQQYGNLYRLAAAHRYLGVLALAEGDTAEAQRRFAQALEGYTVSGRRESLSHVHIGLARAALQSGDPATAEQHVRLGLAQALEQQSVIQGLEALAAYGALRCATGSAASGAAVLRYVQQHPNSSDLLRRQTAEQMARCGVALSGPTPTESWDVLAQALTAEPWPNATPAATPVESH